MKEFERLIKKEQIKRLIKKEQNILKSYFNESSNNPKYKMFVVSLKDIDESTPELKVGVEVMVKGKIK